MLVDCTVDLKTAYSRRYVARFLRPSAKLQRLALDLDQVKRTSTLSTNHSRSGAIIDYGCRTSRSMTAVRYDKAASPRRLFGLLALPVPHLSLICRLRSYTVRTV